MTWTDEASGKRPACDVCGEHRWAYEGYCLSLTCAGHYTDAGYPRTKPLPEAKSAAEVSSNIKLPKKPPKNGKGQRAIELQYEALGQVAPWLLRATID